MSYAGSTGRALLFLGVICVGAAPALADRFVSTLGSDAANNCASSLTPCRTITGALAQAVSGETVKLAEGAYLESSVTVAATTTLVISGGWSADYATQSSSPAKTKVDARFQGPVFIVSALGTSTVDLTLDTVTITKGSDHGITVFSDDAGSLTLTVVNSVLRRNKSVVPSGGAILTASLGTSSANLIVTNSTFKANRAADGGAIRLASVDSSAVSLTVTGSTFVGNVADSGSGGIAVYGASTTPLSVTIDDCRFKSNLGGFPPNSTSLSCAGAIGVDGLVDVDVVNSVFQTNRGTAGGALRLGGSLNLAAGDVSITNSTFRRNRASGSGGAIRVFLTNGTAFDVDIRNSLLFGNRGVVGQDLRIIDDGGLVPVDVDHSALGDASGPFNDLGGNIGADPHVTSDGHVRSDSPAIDAGTCSGAPTVDFEGDARPTGATCDMGADEFVP